MLHLTRFYLTVFYLLLGLLNLNGHADTLRESKWRDSTAQEAITKIYQDGEGALNHKDWDTALRKFQMLNIKYPKNSYEETAKCQIIYCYLQKNEITQGLSLCEDFINHHPSSEVLEQVLWVRTELNKKMTEAYTKRSSNDHLWVTAGKVWACLVAMSLIGGILAINA